MWTKLYTEWKKAKRVFVKPKLHCYFGRWVKNPYCTASIYSYLRLIPRKFAVKHYRYECKVYKYVWEDDFQEKLDKWHLGWIKPVYEVPPALTFKIINRELSWKTKWTYDDIRFEYNPHFTIVLFGLSFTLWTSFSNDVLLNTFYWESLLYYNYCTKGTDTNRIRRLINHTSAYVEWLNNQPVTHLALSRDYLKEGTPRVLYDSLAKKLLNRYTKRYEESLRLPEPESGSDN